jgi:hypothetical protein
MTVTDVVSELKRLEQARCRAISEGDWDALAALLIDDYSHTHSTGAVQDKATYLQHVRARPRTTTRPDVRVRIYGDAAIMNGRQVNTFDEPGRAPVENEVMQVWVQTPGGWKMAAFQSTSPRT